MLQLLFADPSLVTRQMVDDVLKYKRLDGVDDALRHAARRACSPTGASARARSASCEAARRAGARRLGRAGPDHPGRAAEPRPAGARVDVLDGAGHSPHMEAAGEVNRLLEGFLAKAPV